MKKLIIFFLFITMVHAESTNSYERVFIETSFGLDEKYSNLLKQVFPENQMGTKFVLTKKNIPGLLHTLNVTNFELNLILKNVKNINSKGYKRIYLMHNLIDFSKFNDKTTFNEFHAILSKCIRIDFSPGSLQFTNHHNTVSISELGFMRLKDSKNKFYYTRTGFFSINKHNQLMHDSGFVVTDNLKIPSSNTYTDFKIYDDGSVYLINQNSKEESFTGHIKLYNFRNSGNLVQIKPGLFVFIGDKKDILTMTTKQKGEHGTSKSFSNNESGTIYFIKGFTEMSNVNSHDEYWNIIILERLRSMIIDTIHKLDSSFARDYSNAHSNQFLIYQKMKADRRLFIEIRIEEAKNRRSKEEVPPTIIQPDTEQFK
ncbi:MAG: hypothetical protein ABUK01_18095 [Leptospirales bacterium]